MHYGKVIGDNPVFRELSESFNAMAEELENTQMLRSDFINNFSHEFKTPIVSIAGFAKLLRPGAISPTSRRRNTWPSSRRNPSGWLRWPPM